MYFTGKHVLVTGGAGLIGHEAVAQLLDRGAYVRATVFRERRLAIQHPRLEIVPCDLMRPEDCAAVVRDMEVVLHAAAYIRGVKGQQASHSDLVMRNLIPAVQMIDASCRAGVERFGWIGSSTVYPDADHPLSEEEAFFSDPLDHYFGIGWVKRYGEKLCLSYQRTFRTKFALVRSGAIYGPHERFTLEDGHVLPALIVKAVNRLDPFPVWGDGSDVRDFVYVSDFVEGLLRTVERHAVADPVNIATGVGSSINDALRIILDYEGYHPGIVYQQEQASVKHARRLDVRKAKRLLQFEARTSLEAGLRKTIDWYKSTLANQTHGVPARHPAIEPRHQPATATGSSVPVTETRP